MINEIGGTHSELLFWDQILKGRKRFINGYANPCNRLIIGTDFTATLDRAFSGICWNNQMNICQEKFDRQNYGR
ncbi:hypothetical protein GQ55_9G637700 [Panicum hallii var. hallii]|uniref:Uncharacterized protein n=1 Tax=Panicum hallii var. hallii TaxID=1504633 RepID=A0A2T7CIJ4_9POAL|nr:hypothetical protein GQ55_9G637700 [Panicum hallii var. hallii]